MSLRAANQLCPCCSGKRDLSCCQPFHQGLPAPNPEALMRSRYSAFVREDAPYLMQTLHKSQHQPDAERQLRQSFANTQWLGLEIQKAVLDKNDKNRGYVEFCAYFRETGTDHDSNHTLLQLHELSHFVCEQGVWYYLQGEFLPDITLSRNRLCFCGSGKKIKRCCMASVWN